VGIGGFGAGCVSAALPPFEIIFTVLEQTRWPGSPFPAGKVCCLASLAVEWVSLPSRSLSGLVCGVGDLARPKFGMGTGAGGGPGRRAGPAGLVSPHAPSSWARLGDVPVTACEGRAASGRCTLAGEEARCSSTNTSCVPLRVASSKSHELGDRACPAGPYEPCAPFYRSVVGQQWAGVGSRRRRR